MENERLPDDITTSAYLCTTMTVFFYEFLGTFCLVGVINATKGDAASIGLTLFFLLLLTGPISGGHMNPSVTIGVWLNRVRDAHKNNSLVSCTLQACSMICAQIVGAIFSMWIFLLALEHVEDGVADKNDFPHLVVKTRDWSEGMFIEGFCTFIFVTAVLLVKDRRSSMFSASINESVVGFFGCAVIAVSLTAMILFAGPHTSASLNPAVSISQTILDNSFLKSNTTSEMFWKVYMLGPFLGAILAGFFSWVHAAALAEYGPKCSGDKEAPEAAPLIKKEDNKKEDEENLLKKE